MFAWGSYLDQFSDHKNYLITCSGLKMMYSNQIKMG